MTAIAAVVQAQFSQPAAPGVGAASPLPPRALFDKYCVTCHNARLKTAGLMLDTIDVDRAGDAAETLEKLASKLRPRESPPAGAPRPDAVAYRDVIAALESALDRASESQPHPGRVPVHRLNRTEYANAIPALVALAAH